MIPDSFRGAAYTLCEKDIARAAAHLQCDIEEVEAVLQVESGGRGFLTDKRPTILFEARWFHKFTNGLYDIHGTISQPTWEEARRQYRGGNKEYDRLNLAYVLDVTAALKSTSWGMFQIMGFNHAMCGYDTVQDFVMAMCNSEGQQLDAFAAFILASGLDDELDEQRWAAFARGYNGPGYQANRYDEKLALAYSRARKRRLNGR